MFLAVGNVNYDYLIYSIDPPKIDSKIEAYKFLTEAGGSACNFAVAVVKLGVKCGVLGCIGRDGDWLLRRLRERGVNTSTIFKIKEEVSGRVFVIVDQKGNRTMIAYKGANKHLKPEVFEKINISIYEHIHFSGCEIGIVRKALELKDRDEKTLSYDPGSTIMRKYSREVMNCLKFLDYLFVNEEEFNYFLKKNLIKDLGEIFERSEKIRYIFVKRGSAGSTAISKNSEVFCPAFKVKVVDTTGAGDAFNAGVLVGLKRGLSVKEALLLGNAVAALKIMKEGAQSMPLLDEVINFIEKHGYTISSLRDKIGQSTNSFF
ncbi:MAG: hypothetical protein DRJ38_09815 [Thermoprotei archaeon]|nr:MAG: hypothetical protein DRJ38_09815 [Thermoprotei archaeon]